MDKGSAGNEQKADEASFETVFKTHFKNLHSYATTIVRDEVAAEEIVQNVFFKLWERRDKINIEQSIAAYLYRSVYNESLNFLKHMNVKASHQAHVARQNAITGADTDPATVRELRLKIDEAIKDLPEQCRTVFQMSRFEGMRYLDIADRLGISVKTVENQMGKALRVMRTKLSDYLPVLAFVLITIKLTP